ncbi:MAG: hypothetical protein KBD78_12540 [Oligoflexales bacterium]|nr:hypothetical protein [Oligoflexales bacterium]
MLKDLATILPLQDLALIFPLLNLFGPNPQTIEDIVQNRGGVDGGGGDAVVCRNFFGGIKNAEMLDVWEGKNHYKLSISESKVDYKLQIDNAIAKLPSNVDRALLKYFASDALQNMEFISKNTKLAKIDDSYEVVVPKKCKIEQVAVFQGDRKLLVDSEIWKKFSQTSRAALILHEANYFYNRTMGAKDSRQSRYDVGLMLSNFSSWVDPGKSKTGPAQFTVCFSDPDANNRRSHIFEVIEVDDTWLKLEFMVLNYNNVLNSKYAIVAKEDFPYYPYRYNDDVTFDPEWGSSWYSFTEQLQTGAIEDELSFTVEWESWDDPSNTYNQIATISMDWKSGTHNDSSKFDKISCVDFLVANLTIENNEEEVSNDSF